MAVDLRALFAAKRRRWARDNVCQVIFTNEKVKQEENKVQMISMWSVINVTLVLVSLGLSRFFMTCELKTTKYYFGNWERKNPKW